MLMVLQPVQVRFEWVYAELLWIYLLNTATSFWIRQQRWDVQNIMTLRITLWHIEMRSTVFLNIINLTLLTYTLWISACIYFSCFFCCFFFTNILSFFFYFFFILFNLFSLSLSHIDIWLQSVITLFIKVLCKFNILHLLLPPHVYTPQPCSLHSDIWLRVRFTFKGTQEAAYFRDGQAAVIYSTLTL